MYTRDLNARYNGLTYSSNKLNGTLLVLNYRLWTVGNISTVQRWTIWTTLVEKIGEAR
jgi:hypothetical protein